MTLDEFFAEAKRIGLTAEVFAAQLAARPEFADCVPLATKEGAAVPVSEHKFVQPVPDHCDRITWRGAYYHLHETTPPAVMPAEPSDAVDAIMFMVYEYARISDGIDGAEGEARGQQLAAMRAKGSEIRVALTQPATMQPQAGLVDHKSANVSDNESCGSSVSDNGAKDSEYPPLPEPGAVISLNGGGYVGLPFYTADQMRAYVDADRASQPATVAQSVEVEPESCPRCDGEGTKTVMSDGGPDTYEVEVECSHCKGNQTLRSAYDGVLDALRREENKYRECAAILFLGRADRKAHDRIKEIAEYLKTPKFSADWAHNRLMALADMAKVAAPSAPAESGWQWVPVEPTDEMLKAGRKAIHDSHSVSRKALLVHKAMLKAAPSAAQPGESEGGA